MQDPYPNIVALTAAYSSYIIKVTLDSPKQRIKLLLQSQPVNQSLKIPYTGIINCIVRTFKQQGILSFWRGYSANVLNFIPKQFYMYYLHFSFKKSLDRITASSEHNIINSFIAGALSASFGLVFTYPLQFLRTKLAVDVGNSNERLYSGLRDCIKKVYYTDGIKAFYRGVIPSMFGISVYRAAYFGFYDLSKNLLLSANIQPSFGLSFILGYLTTISASLISYPLDTIMVAMITRTASNTQYKGFFGCAKQIWKNKGLKGYYGGMLFNLLTGVLSAAALTIYDVIRQSKKKRN